MRKIIFFLALFCSLSFAQGWNNTITTSISTSDLSGIDLFTNKNGNNIVTSHFSFPPISRWVKYYLLNSSGSVIRSSTIEGPSQNLSGYPAKVSGDNNNVYAVYLINGVIRVKKSVNAGISWTTYDLNPPAGTGTFYGYDIAFDNNENKLHMVYNRGGQTYYYALNANNQWVEFQQVSSISTNSVPTVSFSQNRVHVSYEEGAVAKSRDKYFTSWQTPQTVTSSSIEERIHAGNSKLLYFYSEPQPGYYLDIYVRQRDFNGNWSSPFLLHEVDAFVPSAANTFDSKTHIVYYGGLGDIYYRNYNGSTWSSESTIGTGGPRIPMISSVSNDLFVIWENLTSSYLSYKQYDANPITPANFAGGIHDVGWNAYPKITWNAVNEPDVRENQTNGIIVERSLNLGAFSVVANLSGQATSFIDWGVPYAGSGPGSARYRIKSRDINVHESPWSNIVNIAYGDAWKIGADDNIVSVRPENFYLSSNYPNPFNPSTRINYALPEEANVQLKVYDILGSEVAELVNETKRAGYHIVDFDASNLSSGIYIYRITALSGERVFFNESKRMILMK